MPKPLPFPMPGNLIDWVYGDIQERVAIPEGEKLVVASTTYFEDQRGAVALVLLLERKEPFFTVAHYARTDVRGDGVTTPYKAGEFDVIGRFSNIVEAVREYEQSGGDI